MHLLSQYWWLVVREINEPCYAGQHLKISPLEFQPTVERHYGHFPSAVACALQTLVLYDWDFDGISWADPRDVSRYLLDGQDRWLGFTLPLVLWSGGSLFRSPAQAPDISCLALEPVHDLDGVERGERPACYIYLDATETCSFSRTVTRVRDPAQHDPLSDCPVAVY